MHTFTSHTHTHTHTHTHSQPSLFTVSWTECSSEEWGRRHSASVMKHFHSPWSSVFGRAASQKKTTSLPGLHCHSCHLWVFHWHNCKRPSLQKRCRNTNSNWLKNLLQRYEIQKKNIGRTCPAETPLLGGVPKTIFARCPIADVVVSRMGLSIALFGLLTPEAVVPEKYRTRSVTACHGIFSMRDQQWKWKTNVTCCFSVNVNTNYYFLCH
jgi:hypothetical protein